MATATARQATARKQARRAAKTARGTKIVETEYGCEVGPAGRMTRAISTRYRVGDRVLFTRDADMLDQTDGVAEVGESGVVKAIGICDPNDGDATRLYFDVKVANGPRPGRGGVVTVIEDKLAPYSAVEAWLRRNLAQQIVAPAVQRFIRAGVRAGV